MVEFIAEVKKFDQQGEKTGWTYIEVPETTASTLIPGNRKAFRVKGYVDKTAFAGVSLLPMGNGDFIMALNATLRKSIRKAKGALLAVRMEVDKNPVILSPELMACLADEPAALEYFNKLPGSHQKYYSRWIESGKTEATRAKRIVQTVIACSHQQGYGEMIRSLKNENEDLLR